MPAIEVLRVQITPASAVHAGYTHRITVTTSELVEAALPFVARLGAQDVDRLVLLSFGTGFEGLLRRAPRDGDRLWVGYDAPAQETGWTYPGTGPRVA